MTILPNQKLAQFAAQFARLVDDEADSRKEFAEEYNVPYSTLSAWCTGESYPGPAHRESLLEHFGDRFEVMMLADEDIPKRGSRSHQTAVLAADQIPEKMVRDLNPIGPKYWVTLTLEVPADVGKKLLEYLDEIRE